MISTLRIPVYMIYTNDIQCINVLCDLYFLRYFNYSISRNGKEEKHGDLFEKDYLTDLISNDSVAYIESQKGSKAPFFMMISTPAPHEPWTFNPKYGNLYKNISAPRGNKQWNIHKGEFFVLFKNSNIFRKLKIYLLFSLADFFLLSCIYFRRKP